MFGARSVTRERPRTFESAAPLTCDRGARGRPGGTAVLENTDRIAERAASLDDGRERATCWFELRWHDQHEDEDPDYRQSLSLGVSDDITEVLMARERVGVALRFVDRAPGAELVIWRQIEGDSAAWLDGCPRDGWTWRGTGLNSDEKAVIAEMPWGGGDC